jgi:tetratricopeptide (TPR) repeat protein
MRKSIVLLLCLVILVVCLPAQELQRQNIRQTERSQQQINHQEINILLNQARMHESRRQFREAIEILEPLNERFPFQEQILDSYLRCLINSNDLARTKQVLDSIKSNVDNYFFTRHEIIYLIKNNELRLAERRAFDLFSRNPGMMHYYREIAALFEGVAQFDIAIKIYNQARTVSRDNNLFSLELSNAYYFTKNVDKFFEEAVKFLRGNPGYLYYYRSRFSELASLAPGNIRKLDSQIRETEPVHIYEIYAATLVAVGEFQRATTIYRRLPLQRVINFGDDLTTDGHLDVALEAYQIAISKVDTPVILADIHIKMAQIYYLQRDIEKSVATLELIFNNAEIQRQPLSLRTRANRDARLMMAMISIEQQKPVHEVRGWYEAALNFTNSQIERADIWYSLSRYQYLSGDFNGANLSIESAKRGHDNSSIIYRRSNFYLYEMALHRNSSDRDSLLTECIIHFPEDDRVSDMLFFESFLSRLPRNRYDDFLEAIRYKGLYQHEAAIRKLIELAEQTRIDELFLLAGEWLRSEPDLIETYAHRVNRHSFRNPILSDYFFLQTIRKNEDANERRLQISDFLNSKPQNVFSPHLRMILF